jgi:N-dimethylarginine dimethylaminohydrolase
MHVITNLSQLKFRPDEVIPMPWPTEVLMVDPAYFDILYVINPHMEGNIGNVDKNRAREEWKTLKEVYELLGLNVHVIDGVSGLPDMVFCANQSLPYLGTEQKEVVMSIMAKKQRKDEVEYIETWYRTNNYTVHKLPESVHEFEGMGDAIWHSGRRLMWGGYGFRTTLDAYEYISDIWNVPIIALELTDPDFYHLDTCFCVLDGRNLGRLTPEQ